MVISPQNVKLQNKIKAKVIVVENLVTLLANFYLLGLCKAADADFQKKLQVKYLWETMMSALGASNQAPSWSYEEKLTTCYVAICVKQSLLGIFVDEYNLFSVAWNRMMAKNPLMHH